MKKKRKANRQWRRIQATPTPERELKAQQMNQQILGSSNFKSACANTELEPTKRQARKWKNNKGLAWKEGRKK
uniref:Uncharacterized protein n=1 Tax=viral metagenome TaxID=1070528 RepID=A0A6M3L480_9ZZZZ